VLTYVGRRALVSIPVLIVASVLVFGLVRGFGPDPAAQYRKSPDPHAYQDARRDLGLDRPVVVQYVDWLRDFVTGDWGESLHTGRSVAAELGRSLWETAQLAFWAVVVSAAIAVVIGVYSATRPGSLGDHTLTALAFAGLAVPTFWFGLIVIQFFGYELQQLLGTSRPIFYSVPVDTGGGPVEYFRHFALPVLVVSVQLVAGWSRYLRSSMSETMRADFIRAARAKGVPRRRIVARHGLRNSLTALVTVMAVDIGALVAGLIVTEKVFSIPGMGTLFLDALTAGDTQVLLPWMMVVGAAVIVCNLAADTLYAVLDPRVRLS
jgi:peptide/nickel transport system permease protein